MHAKLLPAIALAAAATAAVAGPAEDTIRFRQSAYSLAAWNLSKIKSQVVTHPDQYNKDEVLAAAVALAGIANSGLDALYAPGTDQGTGWEKTRLKPAYFTELDEAQKLNADFVRESNDLAKVAAAGDVAAIKAQFGKASGTCKSCHDAFRLKDAAE